MRTSGHIITSLGISLANYWQFRSKKAACASFLVGFLVDLDHVVDYVKAHGWKFNWSKFSEAAHENYSGKLFLPLHSFELLALFYITCRSPKLKPYRHGISMSLLLHLLLDQKCNPRRKPLTYFLCNRIKNRFNAKAILG